MLWVTRTTASLSSSLVGDASSVSTVRGSNQAHADAVREEFLTQRFAQSISTGREA